MFPKEPRIRMPKVLAAARGEACTMRIPGVCNGDPSTVVAAHGHRHAGMGQKPDDIFVAFACSACHDEYDGRTCYLPSASDPMWMDKEIYWRQGHEMTLLRLLRKGVLKT